MSSPREVRSAKQAEQEDLFFGQAVILWARWSVIVAGIVIVLWTSNTVDLLTRTMPFFLVLITAILVLWPGAHGLKSDFFVLYFPVVFAFALVFTRQVEVAYTGLAMVAYAAASFLTDPSIITNGIEAKDLVMRLIVIAALGFLGNYYFRIQRGRLARASAGAKAV